jgi:purine-binding chemotaxis protein CheW
MDSSPVQTDADITQQWVSFMLGDETYAIDVMKVQEVLKPVEITPVAGSPHYVLGVINLRGNVVTVIDARSRFNLMPIETTRATRIILVEAKEQVVGVLVDRVGEVLQVSKMQIESVPSVSSAEETGNIQGVTTRDDALVEIVDLDKLLAEDSSQEEGLFLTEVKCGI